MAEAAETPGADAPKPTAPAPDDATYYQAEAKKAFKQRDDMKAKLRELEQKILPEEDLQLFEQLKTQQAKVQEEEALKKGEWEALKTQQKERHDQLIREHQKALADAENKIKAERDLRMNRSKVAAFGAATDFFSGSEGSRTVLDVSMAIDVLGRYVAVEDLEDGTERILVKKPNGDTIFGADGNPAPFADAIGELIAALPNRDRILRGSGKTGSGSSGGSNHAANKADVDELIRRAQKGDKTALAQLRQRRDASGGMVMGEAFTRT